MPLRSLSYVASAARLAQLVPAEQVQIVCTSSVGEQVNGISADESAEQFGMLARFGSHMLEKAMPDTYERTIFAHDTPTAAVETVRPLVDQVLAADHRLNKTLRDKSQKHGSDFATYGAAHVVYQDTGRLELAEIGSTPAIDAQRIVTIGCQQERTFYGLRIGVRQLLHPEDLVPSVQVFTQHISPPYYTARGGEPLLEEAVRSRQLIFSAPDRAANRDLQHLGATLGMDGGHS